MEKPRKAQAGGLRRCIRFVSLGTGLVLAAIHPPFAGRALDAALDFVVAPAAAANLFASDAVGASVFFNDLQDGGNEWELRDQNVCFAPGCISTFTLIDVASSTQALVVEEGSGNGGGLVIRNNGTVELAGGTVSVKRSSARAAFGVAAPEAALRIYRPEGPGESGDDSWRVDFAGNFTALSFNPTSSADAKENFAPVDGGLVLSKLAELPVPVWNFKTESPGIRHIGPMAEEFHALFNVGLDDRHISPSDLAGVAIVGVQALNTKLGAQAARRDARIAHLERELADREARLAGMERRLQALEAKLSRTPLTGEVRAEATDRVAAALP